MPSSGFLLADAKSWWCTLASGIAAHQPAMPVGSLEAPARRLLQILVFLRLAHDLGAFRTDKLPETLLHEKPLHVGPLLNHLRRQFGTALFHAEGGDPSGWPQVSLAAEAVSAVCSQLWSDVRVPLAPETQIDLLGQVHQYLLGHRLVYRGDRLRAESSAAVRKRAGVFYTPQCVTNYIVENSVGQQLRELAAAGLPSAGLRILDPACGCGAFLVHAFSKLLQDARQQNAAVRPLPTAFLHGVDLDPEAVLICRRSLWLQCAQAASLEAAADALNHIAENVRCGDVLLDASLADRNDGFDVVLGNPPYRRELNTKHLLDPVSRTDLGRRYRSPRMDYWYYFLHRGLELLKPGGRLAFIVGAYWTSGLGAEKLIRQIQHTARIEEIFLLKDAPIFEGVSGRHMILMLRSGTSENPTRVKRPAAARVTSAEVLLGDSRAVETFEKAPAQLFRAGRIDLEPPADELLAKIAEGTPLGRLGKVRQGIAENPASINRSTIARFGNQWTLGEGVFALTPQELARLELSEAELRLIRPYYDLCDVDRYYLAEQPSRALIYSTVQTWPALEQCPRLAAHLARFRPILQCRRETRRGTRPWWQLHWPREQTLWRADKVLSVQMGPRPAFVPAFGPVYVPFSVNVFVPDADVREHLHYFAAVLNSRLAWKWYRHHTKQRGAGLEINAHVLVQTPIHRIDFTSSAEAGTHAQLVALVGEMLRVNGALGKQRTVGDANSLGEHLASLDAAINRIVYGLYGLVPSEIELVENATRARR